MKHTIYIKSKFSCLLFLLITSCAFFIACQPKPDTIESHNTAPNLLIKPTTRNELTAPTVPSPTKIPSPTATSTLQPTFSPEEAEEAKTNAAYLYQTNGGCQLPCWWGIIPGKTEWNTAQSFLTTLTNYIYIYGEESGSSSYYATAFMNSHGISYSREQSYTIHNGVVENIVVQVGSVAYPNFTLATILSTYGVPSEIWLDSYGHDDFGEIPFSVVLFYSEGVMLLKYYTNASLIDVDGMSIVEGCIQDKAVSNMGLWSPEAELAFADAVNQTNGMRPSEGYLYRPLEEVTEMNIETFYQTYLDPDTKTCIQTPAEIWQDR